MDFSRYMPLFLAESREHLADAHRLADRLEGRGPDVGELRELYRHVHSLKGMAMTMGYTTLGQLTHALEDLLERPGRGIPTQPDSWSGLLDESLRCLGSLIDRIEAGGDDRGHGALELVDRLREPGPVPTSGPAVRVEQRKASDSPAEEAAVETLWRVELRFPEHPPVSTDRIVAVLVGMGELGRVRHVRPPMLIPGTRRFERRLRLMLSTPGDRAELVEGIEAIEGLERFSVARERVRRAPARAAADESWVRVRSGVIDLAIEKSTDLSLGQARARSSVSDGTAAARQVDHCAFLLRELQGSLRELRVLPFDRIGKRIEKSVRELAVDLGKRVRLRIVGGELRVDRSILDGLGDPLLHMVRNALDHGIESPEERRRLGKNETGLLTLGVEAAGDRIRVVVEDDGRGIDVDGLCKAAIARGLLDLEQAGRMSPERLAGLISLSGLSTSPDVDDLSGRGVGMDVVRDSIERLGGQLEVRSEEGRGTRFTASLPLTLVQVPALLFRTDEDLYAMPCAFVERMLDRVEGIPEGYAARSFREYLGGNERNDDPDPGSWLLLRQGEERIGLGVDEVLGTRDVLVRPLLEPLASLGPYSGGAILEEGTIVLVVDPEEIFAVQ